MGLIFESTAVAQVPQTTATHVLLVGCGEYPYLAAAGFGGLKPLASPRLSVEAIADWFLRGVDGSPPAQALPSEQAFSNPDAPLGSLVMLTSPALPYQAPCGTSSPTTRPTLDNIRVAYLTWLERLANNPDSRGVFYFCGHGLSNGTSQYLVADDFGGQAGNDWYGLFHVSNTCQASIRATAANLFFVVDACMELREDLIHQIDAPNALISGSRIGQPRTTEWAVLRATTANRLAFAPQNGVARFTAALLQALQGHCGSQRNDGKGYDVGVANLREATAKFLALAQQGMVGQPQKLGQTEGEGDWVVPIHVQPKRPSVLVELDVHPAGYRPVARAFMEDAAKLRDLQPLADGPVRFVKQQGEWAYGTNADGDVYPEQFYERRLLTAAVHSYRFTIPGDLG